ncbi:putative alpha/beta hydrolase family esterase [Novosphingobium chloroacetimidivorans]|uniref:Putative alpha/beta hydrolase family esterase n=1 Tax=Novosphingobium chloroacetimidivorans TaxID=1428314 RepID=A0A7W7KC36_9SPHN|nr:alpha/beta hydrolase [Novosphingobium chloroacetimidivorans]MBB4859785.1 putative alpha/beta hydrolase family esterase [Novosphingobium chloroacetimidivorans]
MYPRLQTASQSPAILLVPGLFGSGPEHWQTRWEQQDADCTKVELGRWDDPHRNTWINNLNLAIRQAGRPVVLVAHSLGCLAVAWWARYAQRDDEQPVIGALLVAPPEVDFFPLDERVARFAPTPTETLPFPSRLIASRNDPWMGQHTAQALARRWGSLFVDAGACGHINADSDLGDWSFGREQLAALLSEDLSGTGQPQLGQRSTSAQLKATGRPLARRGLERSVSN